MRLDWKWLVEAPLSRPWRNRLELCLGVVLSGAAMVALSSTIRPSPSKLAHALPSNVVTGPRDAQLDPPAPAAKPQLPPAFFTAIQAGDLAAMRRLYVHGMPLDGTLTRAAETGRKATVLWLLDHGADVHEGEGAVWSPLLSADAYPDVVALLLERGAAEPSLTMAAEANAVTTVSHLLAAHAPVNPKGESPLAAATASLRGTGSSRRLVVSKLLDAGAAPNDELGESALAGAVRSCGGPMGDDSVASDCLTIVRLLLDRGAQVKGDALGAALSLDDDVREPPLAALLAMPFAKGVTATAFARAASVDARDVKRVVAKGGVDWAWHDGEEDAALPVLAAARRGERDTVRAFLDAGAPVDVHFKDGTSALGVAIDGAASSADHARVVELLVARGANVNRRLADGRTPLFAAAESGELRVVNVLLDRGARVNDLVLDDTALDAAEQNNHQPAARVLHAHGGRRAQRTGY